MRNVPLLVRDSRIRPRALLPHGLLALRGPLALLGTLAGAGLAGAGLAHAAPAVRPSPGPAPVVAGAGNQLAPSACTLATGTRLLAFERLQTATARRLYLKRQRPGFGWSYGQEVPLPKATYALQSGSLLCRPGDEVLLYAQAGDPRRRSTEVLLFRGKGDALALDAGRPLALGLPQGSALTDPFAAPGPVGREVLLTVTSRAGADGCYLARSPDGLTFPRPALRVGPGDRCRVVALGPDRLLAAFQDRPSLRHPLGAHFRISTDAGATWSAPQKVASLALESFDPHPVPLAGGAAAVYHVARIAGRWALYVTRIDAAGRAAPSERLTPLAPERVLGPHALREGASTLLYFAREVRPLDFDVLVLPLAR